MKSDPQEYSEQPRIHPHTVKAETVLESLNVTENGLSTQEAENRLKKYGENKLTEGKKKTIFEIFIDQFKDILVWILLSAATISAFQGELPEALLIFTILVVNAIFGVQQEYKADKSIEALKKMSALTTHVIRDGDIVEVDTFNIVPGDMVILKSGDKVPADARILSSDDLKVEEASLTGESVPVDKDENLILKQNAPLGDRLNLLFMGTYITNGRVKAVVTNTGMATEMGQIATSVSELENVKTPFQVKIEAFGKKLGYGILLIAGLVILLGVWLLTDMEFTVRVIFMIKIGISLAIAAIPEGLPIVVTLVLAIGVQKMARQNAIVKRLPVVESLGSATIICSDKTGTLTKNQMTVTHVLILNNDKTEIISESRELAKKTNSSNIENTYLNMIHCSDAIVRDNENLGNPTELAIVKEALNQGFNVTSEKNLAQRLKQIPFDSTNKRMNVLTKLKDGKLKIFVKGAPEVILSLVKKIDLGKEIKEIDQNLADKIQKEIDKMSAQALRVLAFAYLDVDNEDVDLRDVEPELILSGFAGIIDPPKDGIRSVVESCYAAGVRVMMITGDHKLTAKAIAEQVGIQPVTGTELKVLSGPEVDDLSDEEFKQAIKDTAVFARISPVHKLRIVQALQDQNNVVGMTGDGVNDAPALKGADIGIAMGIAGTDVSKEAADMILANDDFVTIVSAIKEGRGIFDNMYRFIRYMLSSNFAEILVVLLALLIGWPVPLVAVQILFINLITDGLPGLAMSQEPHSEYIMERPPRPKNTDLLNNDSIYFILRIAGYVTFASLFMFYIADFNEDYIRASTITFCTLVICQLFNAFNLRHSQATVLNKSFFANPILIVIVIGSIIFQMFIVHGDQLIRLIFNFWGNPISDMFHTTPLQPMDWVYIMLVSVGVIFYNEIFKLFYKMSKPDDTSPDRM
jgi:P-type Ca2+ transporter type 2C